MKHKPKPVQREINSLINIYGMKKVLNAIISYTIFKNTHNETYLHDMTAGLINVLETYYDRRKFKNDRSG